MGTHGWAYRRRQPEGTVLYEAVRENLATLLEEVNCWEEGWLAQARVSARKVKGMRMPGFYPPGSQ